MSTHNGNAYGAQPEWVSRNVAKVEPLAAIIGIGPVSGVIDLHLRQLGRACVGTTEAGHEL